MYHLCCECKYATLFQISQLYEERGTWHVAAQRPAGLYHQLLEVFERRKTQCFTLIITGKFAKNHVTHNPLNQNIKCPVSLLFYNGTLRFVQLFLVLKSIA
jgi:hypothetical protein